jgi:hypothetical protein
LWSFEILKIGALIPAEVFPEFFAGQIFGALPLQPVWYKMKLMLTTIDIPDELFLQAEAKAAQKGVPVGDLIAQALHLALVETSAAGRHRIAFPLHHSARPGTLSFEEVRTAEETTTQQEDASHAGAL